MSWSSRAVGRTENPGGLVVLWWIQSVPLVEIGLTDLTKSGGAMAPPRDDTLGSNSQRLQQSIC